MLKRFWKKPITWGTIITGSLIAGLIEYVILAATGMLPNPKEIGESVVDKVKEKVGKN